MSAESTTKEDVKAYAIIAVAVVLIVFAIVALCVRQRELNVQEKVETIEACNDSPDPTTCLLAD